MYFQEPNRFSALSVASTWNTAVQNAKSAGAAAWTFHNRYDNTFQTQTSFEDLLEQQFPGQGQASVITNLNSTLQGVTWGAVPHSLMVDFGTNGLYLRERTTLAWGQMNPLDVEGVVAADLNGNGTKDVVVDFGAVGLWVFKFDDSTWVQLNPSSPNHMAAGDLDGDGIDELVLDFQNAGIWAYRPPFINPWLQLETAQSNHLAIGNLDGAGPEELVVAFPAFGAGPGEGVWRYSGLARAASINSTPATRLAIGDVNGTGPEDVVVSFVTPHGTRVLLDLLGWATIHETLGAHRLALGNINATPGEDIILSFVNDKTWIFKYPIDSSSWTELNPFPASDIAIGDLDTQPTDDVALVFGPDDTLWLWMNNSTYLPTAPSGSHFPQGVAAGAFIP